MVKYIAMAAVAAILAIANISTGSASPSAVSMREGGYALAPFSFVKFCLDYPDDCPKSAGASRIRLTSERMAELASVNRSVNRSIRPTPDTSARRYWKLDVGAGDCNSFAVQKRHELIARGWPAAALALAVAKTPSGEGHLVVTVRTDQGDLVLDNLRSNIVSWRTTGYDWIMRQSEGNPQYWVALDGGQAGPVAAAADFDDATQVAEADGAADGRQPTGGVLAVADTDAGSQPADAARAGVQNREADAASGALDGARAQAAQASIAELNR
jgi:predicted transglutaminase-like cysteine proteinase